MSERFASLNISTFLSFYCLLSIASLVLDFFPTPIADLGLNKIIENGRECTVCPGSASYSQYKVLNTMGFPQHPKELPTGDSVSSLPFAPAFRPAVWFHTTLLHQTRYLETRLVGSSFYHQELFHHYYRYIKGFCPLPQKITLLHNLY